MARAQILLESDDVQYHAVLRETICKAKILLASEDVQHSAENEVISHNIVLILKISPLITIHNIHDSQSVQL